MRKIIIASLLALTGGFVVLSSWCPTGRVSFCNFKRIQHGMTLSDVQRILGAGKQIRPSEVPSTPTYEHGKKWKPVVSGETFYFWGKRDVRERHFIIIGFREGKVLDTYYFEPEL
jgi:hypothetical protein